MLECFIKDVLLFYSYGLELYILIPHKNLIRLDKISIYNNNDLLESVMAFHHGLS